MPSESDLITSATIEFPSPPPPVYPGGCTLEPAPFALDFLVKWRADVRVAGRAFTDVVVLDLLRDVGRDPAAFGVTPDVARGARERFVRLAGQALEREGGDAAWLEREFVR